MSFCNDIELAYTSLLDKYIQYNVQFNNNITLLDDAITNYWELDCANRSNIGTCRQNYDTILKYYTGSNMDTNPYARVLPSNLSGIQPNNSMVNSIKTLEYMQQHISELSQQLNNCGGV